MYKDIYTSRTSNIISNTSHKNYMNANHYLISIPVRLASGRLRPFTQLKPDYAICTRFMTLLESNPVPTSS